MKKAVLVSGIPGTGKSRIAKSLINVLQVLGEENYFKEALVVGHKVSGLTIIGDYSDKGETFPGGDKLSMAVSPEFQEYVKKHSPNLFIEGDRLVGNKTIDFLLEEGYDLRVIILKVPQEIVHQRYIQRGSHQDPTFLKSKATKVSNISSRMDLNMDGILVEMDHVTNFDTNEIMEFVCNFMKE